MKHIIQSLGLIILIWMVPASLDAQTLQVSLTGPDSVCQNSNSGAFLNAIVTGGTGSATYTWTAPSGTPGTSRFLWVPTANLSPGIHTVSVCVTDSGTTVCDTFQFRLIASCPIQVNIGHWPDTACVGKQVQFADSIINGGQMTYIVNWDFGDGNTSTQQWPTHVYTSAGTYTAELCVIDPVLNDTTCATTQVVVSQNCPTVSATIAGPDSVCLVNPLAQFTATATGSSNPSFGYRWTIGNRIYGGTTINHTFTTPGTHIISLRVIDYSIPDTTTIFDTVVVQSVIACGNLAPLQVDIQGPDSICVYGNNWATLNANVTGGTGQYSYNWSNSIGGASTRSTHFVWSNTPGIVTVILDVTDNNQFAGSDTLQIVFSGANCPAMQAGFGFSPDTPCVGRRVQFWDSLTNASNQVGITWDFGDGTTATGQIWAGINHTYTTAGTYTVTYCAYDSARMDTACVSRQVTVNANCPQLTATISGPDTICIGNPVAVFTANASGSSTPQLSYRWQIGTSTYFNNTITHTFSTPGTYGVQLRVIDWSIPDTFYIQDTIVVEPGSVCLQPLTVAIQGPDTVCLGNGSSASLTANVTGGTGQYIYNWNDSQGGRSTRANHFVWSSSPNTTVTVWLNVLDSNGQFAGSDTFQVVFTTGGTCPPIVPSFGFWPNPPCAGQPIQLWDSTGIWGGSFLYSWDMGDGSTYNNPGQLTHIYTQGGNYTITYCIIDTSAQDTFCTSQTIQVNARCWPMVSADSVFVMPDSVCPGQSLTYFGSYSGGNQGNVQVSWDFGDGNQASGPVATHAYATGGNYTVQFCVIDSIYGDTSCLSKVVTILSTCADTVSGYLYHDVNQDGSYNAGDSPLGGHPVTINPGGSLAFSDAQGFYQMALAPGTYTVNAATIASYANTSPVTGSYSHTLTGTFTNQQGDFGYDSVTSNHDLYACLFCSTPRPGFSHWISVYFANRGTTPVSGTITLSYDPQTNFQYTTPLNNGVHDAVNHTVSWTFTNLPPSGVSSRVRAYFQLPATVPLGAILNSSVRIDPVVGDINITNNLDACARTVVGSYDPNAKEVNQPPIIQGDEWLLYTVQFQNTGTDTAFNVEVRDAIDANLDMNTFQMLGASHNYRLNIDNNGEAVWSFANILLPDSNTNEPLSHGDIVYRIKPKQGLVPGITIQNTAAIYFDFNSPIITNTTSNMIAHPLAIEDGVDVGENAIPGLKVFPNPANSLVNVEFENARNELHKIMLFGTNGQVIKEAHTHGKQVNLRLEDLPSGVYLLRITDGKGMFTHVKLMVQ
ncbi:MAG: PKD domain-containing protein [Bacteroidia bacterium]